MAALDEPKGWISIFVGIIVAALGAIPLFSGMLGFNLPAFLLDIMPTISIWLIAGIAFYLFIDALMEDDTMRTVSIIVSLVLFAVGLIEILYKLTVITWHISFLTPTVVSILLLIEGFFLIIAAFAMD